MSEIAVAGACVDCGAAVLLCEHAVARLTEPLAAFQEKVTAEVQADLAAAQDRATGLALVLTRVREKHQERAAGVLWNGPHGACSACMLPYPCAVIRALDEAESTVTRMEDVVK